ncbi:MAG: hypothetical protein NTX23_09455 [Candidatus Bipolaricaulota bacterium]|nr:hypothetical protein [Candidatus Bipolaricaulota bacterium]
MLESQQSDDIESGLITGLFNKRGAHFRDKAGAQERRIAAAFRQREENTRPQWTRARALLRQIASGFEQVAAEEDRRSEFE